MDDASELKKPLADAESVTILVVEKDVLVRTLITDEIREHGYTCIEADKADDALDVLHSHVRVDLLLTSLRLPGTLDGNALARLVRAEFPFIKILMLSGESPDPSVSDVLDAYLPKPFLSAHLIRKIRTLVPVPTKVLP